MQANEVAGACGLLCVYTYTWVWATASPPERTRVCMCAHCTTKSASEHRLLHMYKHINSHTLSHTRWPQAMPPSVAPVLCGIQLWAVTREVRREIKQGGGCFFFFNLLCTVCITTVYTHCISPLTSFSPLPETMSFSLSSPHTSPPLYSPAK